MTYEIALEQVKRHLGPAYVAAIDAHALAYANQTATAITQRDRLQWLIRQIVNDLPQRRDWLNPDYEREMLILANIV